MLLNNQCVTDEIKEEIKKQNKTGDKWKWKHNDPKSMGQSNISSKNDVYSNTCLCQEARKTSEKNTNKQTKKQPT